MRWYSSDTKIIHLGCNGTILIFDPVKMAVKWLDENNLKHLGSHTKLMVLAILDFQFTLKIKNWQWTNATIQ
jgi:hypothetical protein